MITNMCLSLVLSASLQTTTSTVINEFNKLASMNQRPQVISALAKSMSLQRQLTKRELIYLQNYGSGGNFDSFTLASKLTPLSQSSPLSANETSRLLRGYKAEDSAFLLRSLQKSSAKDHKISNIKYSGTKKSYIDLILKKYDELGAEQGSSFINALFSSAIYSSLPSFKFTARDLSRVLEHVSDASLSIDVYHTFYITYPTSLLLKIDPHLLLSKIHMGKLRGGSHNSRSRTLAILLYTYDLDFLQHLNKSPLIPDQPIDLVQDIMFTKHEAQKLLGKRQIKIADKLFANTIRNTSAHSHLRETKEHFLAMLDLAQLVDAKVVSLDQVEALDRFITKLRGSQLRFDWHFDATSASKQFFVKELQNISGVPPQKIHNFFDKFVNAFEATEFGAFKDLYIYPPKDVTSAAITAAVDLFKLELQSGELKHSDLTLYFDLRFGTSNLPSRRFFSFILGKNMGPMDHNQAISFLAEKIKEEN